MNKKYTTFVILICLFCFYFLLKYFNQSLENVQYYHNRILHDIEIFNYDKIYKKFNKVISKIKRYCRKQALFLWHYCVFSSVLYGMRRQQTEILTNSNTNRFLQEFCTLGEIYIFQTNSFTYAKQITGYLHFIRSKKCVIITCCSTSNLGDVSLSLSRNLVSFISSRPLVQVHEGYYNRAIEIYTQISGFIDEILNNNDHEYTIFFTGHSMGGAIGSIIGLLCHERQVVLKKIKVKLCIYTFGCPKFANQECQYYINHLMQSDYFHMYNIENDADIVPQKPLNTRYCKVGTLIRDFFDCGNNVKNHGLRVYHDIILEKSIENSQIKFRPHRFDEVLSEWFLDMLG